MGIPSEHISEGIYAEFLLDMNNICYTADAVAC